MLENVKCILESLFEFFINTFYYKINTYILLSCNLRFGIQKKQQQQKTKSKTITIFTISFMNSFCEIINKIWWRTCHKSCSINKFYFVRNSSKILITIFISFFISFSIATEKVLCFSVISLKHSNWPLNSFANTFIIKW